MTQPFPTDNPDAWDYLIIQDPTDAMGTTQYALLCDYDGNRTTTVDSALIISGEGGDQNNLRRNPSKFSFTIKIWTREQMAGYEKALSIALSRSNKLTKFRVQHPALAQLGVYEVFLEGASPLRPASPGGMLISRWSVTERLGAQFFPPQGAKLPEVTGDRVKQDSKPSTDKNAIGPGP